uniref:Major sperm protein n=1 Tax=Strongyloides papillosus TaxID=174720 RepID=A0A0N5B5I0_STREA
MAQGSMSDAEVQNDSEDLTNVANNKSGSSLTSSSEVILISSDSEESLPQMKAKGGFLLVMCMNNVFVVGNEIVVTASGHSKVTASCRRRFDPTVGIFKPWLSRVIQDARSPIIVLDDSLEMERRRVDRKRLRRVSDVSMSLEVAVQQKAQIVPASTVMTTVTEISEFPYRNPDAHVLSDQERVISDYKQVLDANTRIIEAQLLLIRLGEIPKHPVVLLKKYCDSVSTTTYRTLAEEESAPIKFVDCGITTPANDVISIWTKNIKSPFEGISLTVCNNTMFPRNLRPSWSGLRLVYCDD